MKKIFLILLMLPSAICAMETNQEQQDALDNMQMQTNVETDNLNAQTNIQREFRKSKRYSIFDDLEPKEDQQNKKQKTSESQSTSANTRHKITPLITQQNPINPTVKPLRIENPDWDAIKYRSSTINCDCGEPFTYADIRNFKGSIHYSQCTYAPLSFEKCKKDEETRKDLRPYCKVCKQEISATFYYKIFALKSALSLHYGLHRKEMGTNKLNYKDFDENLDHYIRQYKISPDNV